MDATLLLSEDFWVISSFLLETLKANTMNLKFSKKNKNNYVDLLLTFK